MTTLGKYLRIALPFLCLWNAFLAWGNDDLVVAWAVATVGWVGIVIEEYKKGSNRGN
jgi:hypothetical protein